MRPAFVVGGLYSRANGIAWIMRELAAALGDLGSAVDVYGAECAPGGAASIGDIFELPSRWLSKKGLWLGGLSWSPALRRMLADSIRSYDVIHNHSIWMLPNSYASRLAKRHCKPVVITAHGALEPWAIRNSGWKKQIVGRCFQFRDLQSASCIHVNSQQEMAGVRQLGLKNPVAVIPNGVDVESFKNLPDRDDFLRQFPELKGKQILLFMARLHAKKGLQHLLEAWSDVCRSHSDWHLVIAGPDDGFERTSNRLIDELAISRSVTMAGNLDSLTKRAALAAAVAFAQPSFSEGFSMSVIEAMASGLPVLITPGCNFPEAVSVGAAIQVNPNRDSTAQGLKRLISMNTADRIDMGSRGRQMVSTDYTWKHIAEKTLELYRWLATSANQPEFVYEC